LALVAFAGTESGRDKLVRDRGVRMAESSIDVVIEIPRGSRNKYEWDERRCVLRLDRTLYASVHYPTDYGFIPQTRSEDGDHVDALVIVEEPTLPGCHVEARPIGVLYMEDEKGRDDKIVAVPLADPRLAGIASLTGLASHWQREIEQFFRTYKDLEGGYVQLRGWGDNEDAWRLIREARG
jgi:inorganic pyrophosphatase